MSLKKFQVIWQPWVGFSGVNGGLSQGGGTLLKGAH